MSEFGKCRKRPYREYNNFGSEAPIPERTKRYWRKQNRRININFRYVQTI